MTRVDRAVGWGVAVAAAIGLLFTSHAPLATSDPNTALLRLAWSARPERVEACRTLSAEELAELPAHMRQPVVCDGTSAAYRLDVRRDGVLIAERLVRAGGLRHDRPLYIFLEIPQPPGEAAIAVRFDRADTPSGDGTAAGGRSRLPADLPRSLVFERRLTFRPGQVILVTYDPVGRELTAVP